MDRFLLFALERSGSSSLAAALSENYPVVQEPFSSLTGDIRNNPRFVEMLKAAAMLPDQLPEQAGDAYSFNRFHPVARDAERCQAYLGRLYGGFTGIKHVWNTVSEEANRNIIDSCLDQDVHIVFLTRSKLARALVSRFLAQQANLHHLGSEMEHRERWEKAKFQPIDTQEFSEQLKALQQAEGAYRSYLAGKPHLLVTYEQLYQGTLRRRRRVFARLCRFLSVSQTDLDEAVVEKYLFNSDRKQTQRKTLKRIPNYRQLKRLL